jgi:23S rRNA-/tRNA-specific pseudouridylate synthase
MRLDKFLQVSRLVKRRTIANTLCSRGAISVNGHAAKAGKILAVGDVIRLPVSSPVTGEGHSDGEETAEPEYEVLELPSGNVSRARAATLYRPIKP